MVEEVELKLDLTTAAADALEDSDLLSGDPDVAKLRSIYFDTPTHTLRHAGLSLRIRTSGRKRVQTVKASGASAAGLFVRSEWERPVSSDTPILDDTTPIRMLLGDAADAIGAVFEVRVERRSWIISDEGAIIELALDRGVTAVGERTSPICEIEMELKEGKPAALFALARHINAITSARLGVQSKADRGYRLVGPTATMVRAEPVTLGTDITATEAFQQIVQTCIRQFRLNEALIMDGRNPEALHQARVALRRLRSAFTIFKPVIGLRTHPMLREALRWVAAELGEARNLDVLLERMRPGALQNRIAAAREEAYNRIGEMLASARLRGLMLDLAEWTFIGDWLETPDANPGQPARDFAVTALDRFRRKVKKGGLELVDTNDEESHEVRKDAKKLRYATEFFASLFGRKRERRRHRKFGAALEALQEHLGTLNDLSTARQVLEALGALNDPDARRLLAHDKRKRLLVLAAEAHEDLIDMKRFWR